MRYWEIIADNLSKAGWSWGCVSAVDSEWEQSSLLMHIAATESDSLFARTKLAPFLELERAIRSHVFFVDELAVFLPDSTQIKKI